MDRSLSERVRSFVFQHVDSVELLEILLLLHSNPSRSWTAQSLAAELRSNPSSVEKRITALKHLEVVSTDADNSIRFHTDRSDLQKTIDELSQSYRIHRHRILEIIFAPSKKARDFADAFIVGNKGKDGDE